MPHIKLKPNYKVVQTYYDDIHRKKQLSYLHEGSVAPHFARLLEYCSKQLKWTLVEQYSIKRKGRNPLRADGALLDKFNLVRGVWEAKDEDDDLEKEVRDKFNAEPYSSYQS